MYTKTLGASHEDECSRISVDEHSPITHKGTLIRVERSNMTESLLVQGQLSFSPSSLRKKLLDSTT